eukprot:957301-Heterocapsa_arctica.AAC.1
MRPMIFCSFKKPDFPGSRSGEQRARQPEEGSMPFSPRQGTSLVEVKILEEWESWSSTPERSS